MTAELIARLESADGPSRELFEAAKAVWVWDYVPPGVDHDVWVKRWNRFHRMLDAEAWTSAAEMLVPKGFRWALGFNGIDSGHPVGTASVFSPEGTMFKGSAATPALALAAAALKARGV